MSRQSNQQLAPRNGHTLLVGIGARISGCANQKELSLDDQIDHGKEVAAEYWDGPVEYRTIATTGKGEALDRPELIQIEAEYRRGELDLYIWEDLGRLVRGGDATRLLGIGVDHGIRTIVPNDCIDTAEPTWEEDALNACAAHVSHNAHTSKRIKKKNMNRFLKFGGATPRPIAGYVVAEDAKTFDDWQKVELATPIIQEGFAILQRTLNGEAVAEFFNTIPYDGGIGFPTGPYCRRKRWDGRMSLRYYRNPMLGGRPSRGTRHTIKHHETGRRISVPNPAGPSFREQPNLAHLDPSAQQAVIDQLKRKHARCHRKGCEDGADPRRRTPRSRTRWPGQGGCTCWYCGHDMVWGGNGMTKNLMCNAARQWRCWNSFGFDGALAATAVTGLIFAELDALESMDGEYRRLVAEADRGADGCLDERRRKLDRDERSLAEQREKLKLALREFGPKPVVTEAMAELAEEERRLTADRRELERLSAQTPVLPASPTELRALFRSEFAKQAAGSPAFGDLLRQVVPEFAVYLVRLCDGGHPLPRARVRIALDGLLPDARLVPKLGEFLQREHTVDLFVPPQRERIRAEAVRLASEGLGPKQIASRITEANGKHPTSTAVQNALKLNAAMKAAGLESPYAVLLEAPADYPKLRRHKNRKYRFEPREGYQPAAVPKVA